MKDIDLENNKIKEMGKELHNYSDFPIWDILYTMSSFLSYVEGEKYIPYITSIVDPSVIVKESIVNGEELNSGTIYTLYNKGDLIYFNSHSSFRLDLYDNSNNENYKIGNFEYLNDFIHSLVQYRIDNNRNKDMNFEDDLYKYVTNYLVEHKDLISKNKEKRKEMLQEEFWNDAKQKVLNNKII